LTRLGLLGIDLRGGSRKEKLSLKKGKSRISRGYGASQTKDLGEGETKNEARSLSPTRTPHQKRSGGDHLEIRATPSIKRRLFKKLFEKEGEHAGFTLAPESATLTSTTQDGA